jgi:hypothetical protein
MKKYQAMPLSVFLTQSRHLPAEMLAGWLVVERASRACTLANVHKIQEWCALPANSDVRDEEFLGLH